MATQVLMPQLGESIAEGTIVRWIKAVGDAVHRDEPLFEISTDKVDAEIPAPAAGVLTEIRVKEGETVPVDSVVAVIGQAGEKVTAEPEPREPPQKRAAAPAASTPASLEPRRPFSPVVRRLAREHQIDLATVQGTGAGGRVTKDDVLRLVEAATTDASVERTAPAGARVEPMSVMRRQIAERMLTSRRTSAHVHTVFDVDCSRLADLRARHRVRFERGGAKLTYLTLVAKAVVDAVADVPVINTSVYQGQVVYPANVNLGIAVALDDGLIVPVVKRADTIDVIELARQISDLADRARAKRLSPDDVADGTLTITNPGAFGSILGMPIINQPQVAIVCMGAVESRPAVVDGAVVPQHRAYLTLGFDHRVIDGAVADRFMASVKRRLEQFDEHLL